MEDYLIFLLSLSIILILFVSVVLYQAKKMREVIAARWRDVWLLLYHRHNLLPNLLETFRGFFPHEKGVFQELIVLKDKATHLNDPNLEKLQIELELSIKLAQLMEKSLNSKEMVKDTNFLELKYELKGNALKTEGALALYNEKIREYNKFLAKAFFRPVAVGFRLNGRHIFEYEAGVI